MSYGIAFAGDSLVDLKSLELWLQEEVLDELERLIADPSSLPSASADAEIVYAFSRDINRTWHYVAVTLGRNDVSQTLTVLGLSHRAMPPNQQP